MSMMIAQGHPPKGHWKLLRTDLYPFPYSNSKISKLMLSPILNIGLLLLFSFLLFKKKTGNEVLADLIRGIRKKHMSSSSIQPISSDSFPFVISL